MVSPWSRRGPATVSTKTGIGGSIDRNDIWRLVAEWVGEQSDRYSAADVTST